MSKNKFLSTQVFIQLKKLGTFNHNLEEEFIWCLDSNLAEIFESSYDFKRLQTTWCFKITSSPINTTHTTKINKYKNRICSNQHKKPKTYRSFLLRISNSNHFKKSSSHFLKYVLNSLLLLKIQMST